ncbi:MAG: T9SS type A sorting domain-containing protein [Fibrobacter sp.]|nr:T9SS type A sorting domain-containing protein [Fibrobacter sp.]
MGFKRITALFLLLIVYSGFAQLPSFPGAEGFGRFALGGRGGDVYQVTNLADSGPGSLRDAVSVSNRIVVFTVGGVINISDRIVIKKNIYIAGQTAPGGGITIYGNGVALNGDSGNNIIRYIRIRMGQNGESKKDALAISAGQNYMLDHVSISWGIDGTLDVNGTGIDNVSLQNSIVGQGINIINHSTGGLMQSGKWSIIRSLYIDNKTRNPKARGTHECINSVFYNWGTNGYIMGDTEGLSECNLIGNYFIYGPSSSSGSHITNTTAAFHVYGKDNWVDDNKNGKLDGTLMTSYKTATVMSSPYNHPGVSKLLSAQDALENVIDNVGASIVRDAVDDFLINELVSYGQKGKIITTEDENGIPNNVGTVTNGTPPVDTDKDGMPDSWEVSHGLNPSLADDCKLTTLSEDGYTNVEMYINELAGDNVVYVNDDRKSYSIKSLAAPGGSITQSPEGSKVLEGTKVTLTAVPNGGWTFTGWSGDHTGTNATYSIASLSSDVSVSASFMPIDKFTYQAENGVFKDAVVETKNAGFTGDAYVNISAVSGSFVEIPVYVDDAGQKNVHVTFSNGSGAPRALSVSINGTQQIASVQFDATADWTTWASKEISVTLPQGISVVTLGTIKAQDGPNIDKIVLGQGTHVISHGSRAEMFHYYLDPAQRALSIQANSSEEINVSIFSLNGKKTLSRDFQMSARAANVKIPLNGLTNGMYLVRVKINGFEKNGYINLR